MVLFFWPLNYRGPNVLVPFRQYQETLEMLEPHGVSYFSSHFSVFLRSSVRIFHCSGQGQRSRAALSDWILFASPCSFQKCWETPRKDRVNGMAPPHGSLWLYSVCGTGPWCSSLEPKMLCQRSGLESRISLICSQIQLQCPPVGLKDGGAG